MTTLSPRQLWIQALRSGEYKQCRNSLSNQGAFCCLGVACEIYQKHVGDLEIIDYKTFKIYNDSDSILPEKVVKWLKLKDRGGDNENGLNLIEMNDGGKTFNEIAELIEKDDSFFVT